MAWWSGLDGTGDQTTQAPFTTQSLQAMLQQMGITLPPGATCSQERGRGDGHGHAAAFAQPGQAIDVNVSSIGNAKSCAAAR
jgi:flagellar P-ring protein precursor FlgI